MNDTNVIETHVSRLFFTPDRVFKLLKPLANDFLDHRSAASRADAAQREFELNHRVSPDVYLGTADVVEHGELADRMVVMTRLPADRSMTNLIRAGELTDDHVRETARAIARFHAAQEPIDDPTSPGSLDAHRQRWEGNYKTLDSFVGPILDESTEARIKELVERYLDGHPELFASRIEDGWIVDGHGDLLADDIFCLADGPKILDCLAFRDDFRIADVLSDIAFLAMDLHRLAGPDIAQQLIRWYCEFTGEVHPGSLAHHYVAYRAHVRCKVACLRAEQGALEFGAVARMYHRMALEQLERAVARVVVVGGGPGAGKTTLARAIGEHYEWPVLSSDDVRKECVEIEDLDRGLAVPDEGIYEPEVTEATYNELRRRADAILASGRSVVLDASWTSAQHRAKARAIAETRRAELVEIECVVPLSIARERVARRIADGWGASDATPEIVDLLHHRHDDWPEAHHIDTSIDKERTFELALVAMATAR